MKNTWFNSEPAQLSATTMPTVVLLYIRTPFTAKIFDIIIIQPGASYEHAGRDWSRACLKDAKHYEPKLLCIIVHEVHSQ